MKKKTELTKVLNLNPTTNAEEPVLEYLKSYKVENISLDKFLDKIIKEWEESTQYKDMLTGKKYYQNKNEINEKKRYRPSKDGGRIEDTRLNNARESHPFLRKLVKQKSNRVFSNPFTLDTEDETYADIITNDYLGKKFKKTLVKTGEEAIQTGIAWIQVYYDDEGNLQFKRIPSEQCIPMWRDIDHTELDGMVRILPIKIYKDEEIIEIKEVEFYVGPNVFKYKVEEGKWTQIDTENKNHFSVTIPKMTFPEGEEEGIIQKDENGIIITEEVQISWDRIPFIPFKYNSDEMPLINQLKELIDSYDKISSMATDVIVDVPNSIKVVKNYDGTDLGELTENLYTYRIVKVSDDGGIENLESNLDMTPIDSQLTRLRKDIYDMGQGVDTQNTQTGEKSGVTLKFLYSDLDLDCEGMTTEFRDSLEQILFFIDVDLQFKGIGDYFDTEVDFVFHLDGLINETEVIENLVKSMPLLPTETLVARHPYVDDATKVLDLLEKQKQEEEEEVKTLFGNFRKSGVTEDDEEE